MVLIYLCFRRYIYDIINEVEYIDFRREYVTEMAIKRIVKAVVFDGEKPYPVSINITLTEINEQIQLKVKPRQRIYVLNKPADDLITSILYEIWNNAKKMQVIKKDIIDKSYYIDINITHEKKEFEKIEGDCSFGAIAIGFYAAITDSERIKCLQLLTEKDIINPKTLSDKFKIFSLFENNNQDVIKKEEFTKEYLYKNLNRIISTYKIDKYLEHSGKGDYIINTDEDVFNEVEYRENLYNNRSEINRIFKDEIRQLNEKRDLKDVFVIASVDTDKLNEVGELLDKLKVIPDGSIVFLACNERTKDDIEIIEKNLTCPKNLKKDYFNKAFGGDIHKANQIALFPMFSMFPAFPKFFYWPLLEYKNFRIITINHINDFVTMLNPELQYNTAEMIDNKNDETAEKIDIKKHELSEAIPSQNQKTPFKINKTIKYTILIALFLCIVIFAFNYFSNEHPPPPPPPPPPTHKIDSPGDDLHPEAAIISYDGKYIVTQEYTKGRSGINIKYIDGRKENIPLKGIEQGNHIKAMAFSPTTMNELAIVYHKGEFNKFYIVDVEKRIPEELNPIKKDDEHPYYHFIDYTKDGKQLSLKGDFRNESYQSDTTINISENKITGGNNNE